MSSGLTAKNIFAPWRWQGDNLAARTITQYEQQFVVLQIPSIKMSTIHNLYIFDYMYLCALGRVICVSAGSSNANSISYYQAVANQIVSLDMAKSCQTDVNDVVSNTNGNALNFDCNSNLQYVCRAPIPPLSPQVQLDCCLGSHYINGCSVRLVKYLESRATSS